MISYIGLLHPNPNASLIYSSRNIRPGSIMFFPTSSEVRSSRISSTPRLDYSKPFLVGFGHARIDDRRLGREDPTRTQAPGEITLDEYQHPKKIEAPLTKYSRFFDVYSVGCVLLEIGMWQPLSELVVIPRRGRPAEANRAREDMKAKAESLIGYVFPSMFSRPKNIY